MPSVVCNRMCISLVKCIAFVYKLAVCAVV